MGMRCDVDSFGGAWVRWSMERERGGRRRNRRWRGKVLMTSKRRCVYERGEEGMERSGELNSLFFCSSSSPLSIMIDYPSCFLARLPCHHPVISLRQLLHLKAIVSSQGAGFLLVARLANYSVHSLAPSVGCLSSPSLRAIGELRHWR
jgi:hypothetical protein